MIPGLELHENIKNALELLSEAQKHVREQAELAQAECPHMFVLGDKIHGDNFRLCLCCRLEEQVEGNYWWKKLPNSSDRIVLTKDQIPGGKAVYQLRLPL